MTAKQSCIIERCGVVAYDEAVAMQRRKAAACETDGQASLLLLEHPHTYTFGARGDTGNLLADPKRVEGLGAVVKQTDRGGDITYHGPGQLVGYPILNLKRLHNGPRWYVRALEQALIETLGEFDIAGHREPGRPGVWTEGGKIAAIGVHISRGITTHGFALNVNPDLGYFSHIVPCGLDGVTVTSMEQELREAPEMDDVMSAFANAFGRVFEVELLSTSREESLVG